MTCFLGLGSNLGDRRRNLRFAVDELSRRGFPPLAESSVWETEPVDSPSATWFWNMVLAVATGRDPRAILGVLHEVERQAGRVRTEVNGARTLDLDLLKAGELVVDQPGLQLPHPRMWERGFVLGPLSEIAPLLLNPASGRTVREEWGRLADGHVVRKLGRLARR